MEEQLKQYLTEFVEMLKQGGQFALDQMPEFIHEYLTYYAWYHGIWASFFLMVIILIFGIWLYVNRKEKWNYIAENTFPCVLIAVIPFGLLIYNSMSLVKVLVAPRLYLIENLLALIK